MSDGDIDRVLALPALSDVDTNGFPPDLPLRGIIANDARIRRFVRGDIIFRRNDYSNSVFILIGGSVRGTSDNRAEEAITPRRPVRQRSLFGALGQLWRNSRIPEFRTSVRYAGQPDIDRKGVRAAAHRGAGASDADVVTRIEDPDEVIGRYPTFTLAAPSTFGEIAALSRMPRTATIFADSAVEVVELRWQGLRDIRRWSDRFRQQIDELYRQRGLLAHLRAAPVFSALDDETLKIIADQTLFETYGDFEWTQSFQRVRSTAPGMDSIIEHEPVVAEQGHYLDGLLLVRWGFARLSVRVDHGEMTVGYLTANDVFGLEEIRDAHRGTGDHRLRHSLRAIGCVDVLRVPTRLIERYLLPSLSDAEGQKSPADEAPGSTVLELASAHEPLLDFLVDNRIINGTAAMVIDTNRCVNCDDCVRACASTHDGNPRFVRHGPSHMNVMVANACMHCVDPVCLIGCPTGAIHRNERTCSVIIDDATCIGCATCAYSCPYHNIRMVETRDSSGSVIVDDKQTPILKATKCDLCAGQLGGPACQRACPHDALIRVDIRDSDALNRWLTP
jgi:Fe-S-cluster-containing dehydrogenase component/CRP-like cAMP-binding protein